MFFHLMQITNHPKAGPSHECMQIYIVQLLLLRVTKGPIPSTICTFHKNNRRWSAKTARISCIGWCVFNDHRDTF